MTIEEALTAARRNVPIIYDSPTAGPMLYSRITAILKTFALREDVARGVEPERYSLELADMNRAGSRMVCAPERVREATVEELRDLNLYRKG